MIASRQRLTLWTACWVWAACAEPRPMDPQKSVITVRVYKTGLFSVLGHDHEISAPIAGGTVDVAARQVKLRIAAASLKVADAKVSAKDRAQIEQTMLGPAVLDVVRYPEIVFESASAEAVAAGGWKVRGLLTLHGQTRPVEVAVNGRDSRYTGFALIRQTDFGMKPVRAAGGTVRTKDEIRIEFDLQLGH